MQTEGIAIMADPLQPGSFQWLMVNLNHGILEVIMDETQEPTVPAIDDLTPEEGTDPPTQPVQSLKENEENGKQCFACPVTLADARALKHHIKTTHQHDGRYICSVPFCSWSHNEITQFRMHIVNHSKTKTQFKCVACEVDVADLKALKDHMESDHQDADGCYICPAPGCSYTNLSRKLYYHHVVNHSKVVCPFCGKLYRKYQLRTHILISHEEKKVKCPSCKARFATQSKLKKHTYLVHSNKRPFMCAVCGKSFKLEKGLQQHSVTHSATPLFKCADCGRGFNRVWNYTQHRRIHTGVRPYECKICGERFRHNVTMKQHRQKHSQSEAESNE